MAHNTMTNLMKLKQKGTSADERKESRCYSLVSPAVASNDENDPTPESDYDETDTM